MGPLLGHPLSTRAVSTPRTDSLNCVEIYGLVRYEKGAAEAERPSASALLWFTLVP